MPGKELGKFLKPSPWADPKTQNMPNQLAEDFPDTKPFCKDQKRYAFFFFKCQLKESHKAYTNRGKGTTREYANELNSLDEIGNLPRLKHDELESLNGQNQ